MGSIALVPRTKYQKHSNPEPEYEHGDEYQLLVAVHQGPSDPCLPECEHGQEQPPRTGKEAVSVATAPEIQPAPGPPRETGDAVYC